MRPTLGIAGVTVMLAASACSPATHSPAAPVTPTSAPSGPTAADAAALPPPQALADVMYRLADPAVPGAGKLGLVAGATTMDAVSLDRFANALRDGGYIPVTVTAADVAWSDTHPGDVQATITITGPDPGLAGDFRFPLEFRPHAGGWQLTRETADMLLVFGP